MKELKQNTLAEATTDIGFVQTLNENAGETIISLQREVELEDGTTVTVEGITPAEMKKALNKLVDAEEDETTYQTPGEFYSEEVKGVVRNYNDSITNEDFAITINLDSPLTKFNEDSYLITEDTDIVDEVLEFILSLEEESKLMRITQGNNTWKGVAEKTSDNSFDFIVDENNNLGIMIDTDAETGNDALTISKINGFEDLIIE